MTSRVANQPEAVTPTVTLEPCPFCGGRAFAEPPSLGRSHWNGRCDDCGAYGPHGHDEPQAVRKWNERVAAIQSASPPSSTLREAALALLDKLDDVDPFKAQEFLQPERRQLTATLSPPQATGSEK